MPRYIIHKDGAYNFFSTVVDAACYESALTLEQVEGIVKEKHGSDGMRDLPARLKRAHETGCSADGWTLDDCIAGNRQGPNESEMPRDEFIRRYLTFPARTSDER